MTTVKSEFYVVFSANNADIVPIDLSGAKEVVFYVANGPDGWLTSDTGPLGRGKQFPISARGPSLVVHSDDDRLYWRSADLAQGVSLFVWVIR